MYHQSIADSACLELLVAYGCEQTVSKHLCLAGVSVELENLWQKGSWENVGKYAVGGS